MSIGYTYPRIDRRAERIADVIVIKEHAAGLGIIDHITRSCDLVVPRQPSNGRLLSEYCRRHQRSNNYGYKDEQGQTSVPGQRTGTWVNV